ncbi:MAG: orotidine-5'-phosphate decarboxylase [Halioglobus sp.]
MVALDYSVGSSALDLARRLSPKLCRVKVGKELFTSSGPALVEELQNLGFEVFLDLKFHDIPNTVAGAVRVAAGLGVWMVNVHASGGKRMMSAAGDAVAAFSQRPLLIGVTVLTSMSDADLSELGYSETTQDRVLRLARLASESGLDGVVCSALEAPAVRQARGNEFCLVTPGIRMAGDDGADQRRVVTPSDALAMGANYLVIGRPITAAVDPLEALERVHYQLGLTA